MKLQLEYDSTGTCFKFYSQPQTSYFSFSLWSVPVHECLHISCIQIFATYHFLFPFIFYMSLLFAHFLIYMFYLCFLVSGETPAAMQHSNSGWIHYTKQPQILLVLQFLGSRVFHVVFSRRNFLDES